MPAGHVYIIESDGLVKIGKSINTEKRFKQIETASGRKIQQKHVSAKTERFTEIETELHMSRGIQKRATRWAPMGIGRHRGSIVPNAWYSMMGYCYTMSMTSGPLERLPFPFFFEFFTCTKSRANRPNSAS
jgi:hypothetical protein